MCSQVFSRPPIVFTLDDFSLSTCHTLSFRVLLNTPAGRMLRLFDRHRRLGDWRRGAAPAAAVDLSLNADHDDASNDADDNVDDEWNGGTAAGQL